MGVITEEIELPDRHALGMPAGLPTHSRGMVSEITAFDKHDGARGRQLWIAAAIGVGALVAYAAFGGSDAPKAPPPPAPAPVAAPAPAPTPEKVKEEVVEAPKLVVTKTSAPLPSKGRLSIESEPRVAVYLGDKRIGRTPLDVPFDAGLHELRFVNRRIFLDAKRKVRVRPDKKRSLDMHFGVSTLNIEATPGTKIFIDKRYVGKAPRKPIRIVEGSHHLKLVKNGAKMTERLYVPPSRTIDYGARL